MTTLNKTDKKLVMVRQESECNHNWEFAGYWDAKDPKTGERFAGTLAECSSCGTKREFAHKRRQELPTKQIIQKTGE